MSAQSSHGRWPDFLLIGAMKAGTTTLWGHLSRHSRIFMSTPKEPQYWSRAAVRARGADWYRSLFANARPDQLCGEASACYTRWPEFPGVPELIASQLPRVKLIYLVRHPAERAYSHYAHEMEERALRGTGPQLSFAEALSSIPNLIDASRFDVQIERYLAVFPRSALHVLRLEDLGDSPDEAWARVQDFLELSREPLASDADRTDNRAGDRFARVKTRRMVAALRNAPLFRQAIDLLPVAGRRQIGTLLRSDAVSRVLMRPSVRDLQGRIAPLGAEERSALCARLEPTVRWMEDYLGVPLRDWRR
jgi:hypothetical protein